MAVDVACFAVEFAAVGLSLNYVLRQKISAIDDAKGLLVFAHAFILLIFILEFGKAFYPPATPLLDSFTILTVSLIIWIGVVLSALAYIVYFRPPEKRFSDRLVGLLTKRLFPFGLAMLLFIAYLVAFDAYLVFDRPFQLITARDWLGALDTIPRFNAAFVAMALIAFGVFLAFPSVQYVLSIHKVPDRSSRRAVAVFVAGWDLIAFDGLMQFGFLPSAGVDFLEPGQLIAGLLLLATGLAARRNTMLEQLLAPLEALNLRGAPSDINTEADRPAGVTVFKGSMLLEADPSTNYEKGVRDFAQEMVSGGRTVFAFTSRASPVYLLLKAIPGIRFFVLSESSYPKATGSALEVMVPRNDMAVLLNVMDEAVARNKGQPVAIVFDNISSFILDDGFQECYKFLRQVNEILSHGDVMSIFIVLSKAHDAKTMNIFKNLYSGHLAFDSQGLHVVK